jgi:hypothetical protein
MFTAFHSTRRRKPYLFAAMITLALLGVGLGTLFLS